MNVINKINICVTKPYEMMEWKHWPYVLTRDVNKITLRQLSTYDWKKKNLFISLLSRTFEIPLIFIANSRNTTRKIYYQLLPYVIKIICLHSNRSKSRTFREDNRKKRSIKQQHLFFPFLFRNTTQFTKHLLV